MIPCKSLKSGWPSKSWFLKARFFLLLFFLLVSLDFQIVVKLFSLLLRYTSPLYFNFAILGGLQILPLSLSLPSLDHLTARQRAWWAEPKHTRNK